ncbi:hypothetical protein PBV87_07280 [Niameybacter massiliensis]|uniref:DegT/DnrJ/EryC1/StrS aminotransferase family protein n=1 Tax=Holtiella tumoricola TaxID=3018743 RepID=A0AA42DLE8_9FIRM|nr:hypothetical protein [Holtiella tumoricola]MDA3731280.1 hypothetical protein [Holtiella tumoricola]
MEIGSFLELAFDQGHEYYTGPNVARLNTGRAAIYHAMCVLECDTLWLPYYQCDTVRNFLKQKNIKLKFYKIDSYFNPIHLSPLEGEAVLLVNYFGIMSNKRMQSLASLYSHVIIDNAQAFFSAPIEQCLNVYSARKFIGVPDGAYVIGENANRQMDTYGQDYSADTSLFLLQRIENGCEATYTSRMINEKRLDYADVLCMSKLSHTILDSVNYKINREKRVENFKLARGLFDGLNQLDVGTYWDDTCIPMVYPLVIERDNLLEELQKSKVFQGHWWGYLLHELQEDTFEYYLSRYIIPITIDQRYGQEALEFMAAIIKEER